MNAFAVAEGAVPKAVKRVVAVRTGLSPDAESHAVATAVPVSISLRKPARRMERLVNVADYMQEPREVVGFDVVA